MDLQVSSAPLAARSAQSRATTQAKPAPDFEAKLAETIELLRRAVGFAPVVQASSLGAEDMVITDLIERLSLSIGIFVLETGTLHHETLTLLKSLRARPQRFLSPLLVYRPVAESVVQFVAREGDKAMYRSVSLRKACCNIRKMEPLGRALVGQRAWITGLRREQSGARAEVPLEEIDAVASTDGGPERIKFNPLARWTWGDVWHYIGTRDVAYNPLHDQFFPSIGCAPCTRAISQGEDSRAGRWWWEQDDLKECGLHVRADDASQPAPAAARHETASASASASA